MAKSAGTTPARRIQFGSLLLISILTLGTSLGLAADDKGTETVRATAMGTGSQIGNYVNVRLDIFHYSTDEDRQTLVEAFQKGQSQGLADALSKMKAVGHYDMTGTMGYDVSFIRSIDTPTGRQIRFITNRKLRSGEAAAGSGSGAYDLTAGEINLENDKKKNNGFVYPAAQLVIDKQGELQFVLNQNSWNLINIEDFK
jgi:hypothetical protein